MTGAPRTQGGAAPPPPGVTPNLGDPADVLHTVNMVAQVFSMALVSVFVLLRTYAKAVLAPPFLLDDWACVVAWILSIGYSLTAVMMNHFGGGYHIWEISVEDHVGFLKSLYADTVIYGPNAYFTKVALLLVIARVFHSFTATRVVAHVFIGLMVGYYLPALLIKINVCRPIAAFWTPAAAAADGTAGATAATATCINQDGLFVADTVISAVTDFAVLALPIPATMSLRMSLRRRLRVWAMLGLGGVATLASLVRMVIVIRLRGATDTTVEFVRFNLLGTAEVSIGLICACLPALNILHTKWQQLRNASLTAASWETPGGGAATPSKSPRMRSLKFLHGSRLHTQPPLSAIVAVVPPGAARRSATSTALLDVKRSAASCSGPPPSPPAARVGDGVVTV